MAIILNPSDPMVESSIEQTKFIGNLVSQCAVHGGLFDAMEQFVTPVQIEMKMGVHPSKAKALRKLLELLADKGKLEKREVEGQTVYRRNSAAMASTSRNEVGDLGRSRYDRVMQPWGNDAARYNWIAKVGDRLGHDLSFLRNGPGDKVPFGKSLLSADGLDWGWTLTEPLYELGRLKAVRELVGYGRRFLDLACGPGIDIVRLAKYAKDGCEIVGVDRSSEMLEVAQLGIYPDAKVEFILRDLNTGLPPLPENSFDGILFNGAFHFIEDKKARFKEMYRVLRPGGILSLAHNFSYSGLEDESFVEFYFTLLKEELYPIEFDTLQTLVADAGFVEEKGSQYHRGSFAYLTARKPDTGEVEGR